MRLLIISLFISAVCFGQSGTKLPPGSKIMPYYGGSSDDTARNKPTQKLDSLTIPIFSTKEVLDYLVRINNKAMAIKELELSSAVAYEKLVAELNKIIAEMDKKRKK